MTDILLGTSSLITLKALQHYRYCIPAFKRSALRGSRGFDMASWAVACTNCNSNIVHSQIAQKNLSELFFPPKPGVSAGATVTCPKCGTVVSYVRTDLRYIYAQSEIGRYSDHARSKTQASVQNWIVFLPVSSDYFGMKKKDLTPQQLTSDACPTCGVRPGPGREKLP